MSEDGSTKTLELPLLNVCDDVIEGTTSWSSSLSHTAWDEMLEIGEVNIFKCLLLLTNRSSFLVAFL